MDFVTSRSTPELLQAAGATRMRAGQGIHLIATCLLNASPSQMSVTEIYEWLARKYPRYQYTKDKIRHVLRHDADRKSPRFVIANKYPLRWTIRPEMETQLRLCFSDSLPTEPVSAASCEPRIGSKRVAGGVFPADQSLGKRQRISRRSSDPQPLRDELSAQGSTIEVADRSEAVRSPNVAVREMSLSSRDFERESVSRIGSDPSQEACRERNATRD